MARPFVVRAPIAGSATSVTTTGSGGFMLPVMFFSIPVPGSIQVVPVPQTLNVPQFATSFAFSGPAFSHAPFEPQHARKAGTSKFTPATWNSFRANAHLKPGATSYGSFMKPVTVSASGTATPSMGAATMQDPAA